MKNSHGCAKCESLCNAIKNALCKTKSQGVFFLQKNTNKGAISNVQCNNFKQKRTMALNWTE